MNQTRMKSNGLLLIAAVVWGIAFVAQSDAMNHVGALTFNGARFFLGALVLLPLVVGIRRRQTPEQRAVGRRPMLYGWLWCGATLGVATALQQFGLMFTAPGKAGFLTALYIVLVPFFGRLIGKRIPWVVWVSVPIAVIGLYLLCITDGLSLQVGDGLILLCAAVFAVQILFVGHYSQQVDGVVLCWGSFLVAGAINLLPALLVESNHIPSLMAAWIPLLYTGVISCGVGYTMQFVGQKHAHPTVASLIMSMESVFAALFGWLLPRWIPGLAAKDLSVQELVGCAVMLAAVVLAQLPDHRPQRVPEQG